MLARWASGFPKSLAPFESALVFKIHVTNLEFLYIHANYTKSVQKSIYMVYYMQIVKELNDDLFYIATIFWYSFQSHGMKLNWVQLQNRNEFIKFQKQYCQIDFKGLLRLAVGFFLLGGGQNTGMLKELCRNICTTLKKNLENQCLPLTKNIIKFRL